MFGFKRTKTLAELEVPAEVFDLIAAALREAEYSHAFVDGMLDMSGIGLSRGPEPEPVVLRHRPISTNKAPGAI